MPYVSVEYVNAFKFLSINILINILQFVRKYFSVF